MPIYRWIVESLVVHIIYYYSWYLSCSRIKERHRLHINKHIVYFVSYSFSSSYSHSLDSIFYRYCRRSTVFSPHILSSKTYSNKKHAKHWNCSLWINVCVLHISFSSLGPSSAFAVWCDLLFMSCNRAAHTTCDDEFQFDLLNKYAHYTATAATDTT